MSVDTTTFVDIHCHILPGIDDGARDVNESIQMARQAIRAGVGAIVTTPHHLPRSSSTAAEEASERVAGLQHHMNEAGLDLDLHPGQENAIHPDLIQILQDKEALSLNESDYLLVEPPFQSYPAYVEEVLSALQSIGITPVLAHPERNSDIQKSPEIVADLVKRGIIIQVNTGSFLGHYGEAAQESVSVLLRRNAVHVIATDAHSSSGNRVPNMKKGFEAVAREMGEERAWSLTRHNPLAIMEGREVPDTWEVLEKPLKTARRTFGLLLRRREGSP